MRLLNSTLLLSAAAAAAPAFAAAIDHSSYQEARSSTPETERQQLPRLLHGGHVKRLGSGDAFESLVRRLDEDGFGLGSGTFGPDTGDDSGDGDLEAGGDSGDGDDGLGDGDGDGDLASELGLFGTDAGDPDETPSSGTNTTGNGQTNTTDIGAQLPNSTVPTTNGSDPNAGDVGAIDLNNTDLTSNSNCGQIAQQLTLQNGSDSDWPPLDIEMVEGCLQEVPIYPDIVKMTLESIRRLLPFHSRLFWQKETSPDHVDLMGGLVKAQSDVDTNKTTNQYDFEKSIALLMRSARDGNLLWEGYLFSEAFQFYRDPKLALVCISVGGNPPDIYTVEDAQNSNVNPVVMINDQNTTDFLAYESRLSYYDDPDAQWNDLFHKVTGWDEGGSLNQMGTFIMPRYDPGKETRLTFKDGTTLRADNYAMANQNDQESWAIISNGTDLFSYIVNNTDYLGPLENSSIKRLGKPFVPSTPPAAAAAPVGTSKKNKRDGKQWMWNRGLPAFLESKVGRAPLKASRRDLSKRGLQPVFPKPENTSDADLLEVATYIVENGVDEPIPVLRLGYFPESADKKDTYLSVIDSFLDYTNKQKLDRLIIDGRGHVGGDFEFAYEVFQRIFPSKMPTAYYRFRSYNATDMLGQAVSNIPANETQPIDGNVFSYKSYQNAHMVDYPNWATLFNGPRDAISEQHSMPYRHSYGASPQGAAQDPFDVDNIAVLTDGRTQSPFPVFATFLAEAGVTKTFAFGGRPQKGAMTHLGGSRGAQALYSDMLSTQANFLYPFTDPNGGPIMPFDAPIRTRQYSASVNWADLYADASTLDSLYTKPPTAACRLWYTAEMVMDDTAMWKLVNTIAFDGAAGALQTTKCVPAQ